MKCDFLRAPQPGSRCGVPLWPSFGTEAAREAVRWSPRSHLHPTPPPAGVKSVCLLTSPVFLRGSSRKDHVGVIVHACTHSRGEGRSLRGKATAIPSLYSRQHSSGPGLSLPAV